jgi:FkbM family methyltransferase
MIKAHAQIIKELNLKPKTILEIGSRDGNDCKFYQEQFNIQDNDVYIVEPNPAMYNQIKSTYPHFNVFELAISDKEGHADFNQVLTGGMDPIGVSSLLNRMDDFYNRFETNKIIVNTITGKTLLQRINKEIDICKIDVEGLTYEVLKSFGENLTIKTLHLETEHIQFWENQKTHDSVCELMRELDYKLIWEDRNPSQSDTIWIKRSIKINE